MNRFLSFAIVVSAFCGCQKEVDFDLPPSAQVPGNGSGNGGGSGTGTAGNYQPATKDSYWKYKAVGPTTFEFTSTSTGVKKTVDGISYTVFKNFDHATPTQFQEPMYGMKGRDYFSAFKGVSPNTGASFDMVFRYLNDTAAVGYKWDHKAGQGNGFVANIRGEIIEKNMTITVAGKTYKEVIHTRMKFEYELPGLGDVLAATYDYYAANNVGLVKSVTTFPPMFGGQSGVSELTEYAIK